MTYCYKNFEDHLFQPNLDIGNFHYSFYIFNIHIIQQGKNMVKYTKKVSVFKFTLYHAYKTKQVT